jgi:hypothetical protein
MPSEVVVIGLLPLQRLASSHRVRDAARVQAALAILYFCHLTTNAQRVAHGGRPHEQSVWLGP